MFVLNINNLNITYEKNNYINLKTNKKIDDEINEEIISSFKNSPVVFLCIYQVENNVKFSESKIFDCESKDDVDKIIKFYLNLLKIFSSQNQQNNIAVPHKYIDINNKTIFYNNGYYLKINNLFNYKFNNVIDIIDYVFYNLIDGKYIMFIDQIIIANDYNKLYILIDDVLKSQ